MTAHNAEIVWREFAGEFVQEMLGSVTRSVGRSWRVSSIHSYHAALDEERVWLRFAFSGSIEGSCALGFPKPDAGILTTGIREAEKREASPTSEAECLAAALAALCPELSAAARESYGSFTLSASIEGNAPLFDQASLAIQLHDDRSRSMSAAMWADSKLLESLVHAAHLQQREEHETVESPEGSNENLFARAPNLDLLMDVELDVTLRFGQRHLTLREVLDLTSGSVVELDRQVEEPVELILDGKVIALGEAVVIDGNYGLRVTEVPQPLTSRQLRI